MNSQVSERTSLEPPAGPAEAFQDPVQAMEKDAAQKVAEPQGLPASKQCGRRKSMAPHHRCSHGLYLKALVGIVGRC